MRIGAIWPAMSDHLNLIANRRREINEEIARHSAAIETLKAELPELAAAERVLKRLSGGGGIPASAADEFNEAAVHEAAATVMKPPNIPTIPDMIRESLTHALRNGSPGLTPSGMTSYIAGRYWPNVPGVSISPIAWRMWKRGDLDKEGPNYMLPKNTEAADSSGEVRSAASANQH